MSAINKYERWGEILLGLFLSAIGLCCVMISGVLFLVAKCEFFKIKDKQENLNVELIETETLSHCFNVVILGIIGMEFLIGGFSIIKRVIL